MSRLVQWKQDPVKVKDVPLAGGEIDQSECEPSYAYVYAGHGETNDQGLWRIKLNQVTCDRPGPRHGSIPSVVATPTYGVDEKKPVGGTPGPAILAAVVIGDEISIYSLSPGGQPLSHVTFSWHCVVEGELVTV